MDVFAKKCIEDHRQPLVKLPLLPVQKLFFPAKTPDEVNRIEEHQNYFKTVLEYQKIEKRSARAQAIWLNTKNMAQVTKITKNLVRNFGFQNKEGVFIWPEEMLFLLESNKLEVTCNDCPLTIEQAYEITLQTISIAKYRIYKKLASLGHKLVKYEEFRPTKRASEEEQSDSKRIKKDAQQIENIFQQMRNIMPKHSNQTSDNIKPNYCVYNATNQGKQPNFNLFICEEELKQSSFNLNKLPNIYATCDDDVSFYKLSAIHLPQL
ncbi:unnamed protein product [Ceutorhynchus assimilis]|uniref:tRNA-splicing endonuclease subunit Sen54 N-terminal domain-containing protein n=1 Tax=Ceutorhynchus assimilis TaxID=467358 RepID=A0A9N9MHZ2_9CUCU|nr:unnamed protein product [Ceutorhynchus assimilis]